ncbi:hypothetical protein, partial [Xanthomonas oryzae]|uniref:hypothetical protein n=1 Tax=Xanthomonas oryzae TaxID=347 RepID=UPI000AB202AA
MFTRFVCICVGVCIIGATALAKKSPTRTGATRQKPATQEPVSRAEKINRNTAPVSELGKLPHLSVRAVTAITEARAKSKFKDW